MNPRQLPQMDIIEHFPIPVQQQEEEISWTASSQQQVEFPQHQQDTTTTMLLVSPASKKTKNQEPLPLQVRILALNFSLPFFCYIPLTRRTTSTECNINISIANENLGY